MEFTYESYLELISLIKERGYVITDYENYKDVNKAVILRHDVDLSVEKALKMATMEYEIGVKSTYFVLVTSPFYNIFMKDVQKRLKTILSYGHDIGLHFDELNYGEEDYLINGDIRDFIFKEAHVLEQVIGKKIRAVSMHRPSEKTLKSNYDFYPMINTYGHTFFNEFKYVSDSRRVWHEDVKEIVKLGKYNNIQILTHAFWYNDIEISLRESFEKYIFYAKENLYNNLNNNIKNFNEIIALNELI